MYKVGKALFVAGLLVASAHAADASKPAVEAGKEAVKGVVARCGDAIKNAPSATVGAGKSFVGSIVKCLQRGMTDETIAKGGLKYWGTVVPRVLVAAAITGLVVKGAIAVYNENFASKTKSTDTCEEETVTTMECRYN